MWVTIKQDAGDSLKLSVSNKGGPFAEQTINGEYGFGLSMVDVLSTQLGGRVYLSNEPRPTATVEVAPESVLPTTKQQ